MQNFNEVYKLLEDELAIVDNKILKFSEDKSPLILEITKHLILSGGKRVRPILHLLSSKLCGAKNSENHCNLSASIELIHSATLLHDDVVDNSQVRRGKKTANNLHDNKASILVGDYLFSVAFQLMTKTKNIEVLNLLAQASSIMADGEVMQLENSNDINLTLEKYCEIIFGKTAILFSASCEAGALINNASNQKVLALREFGKNLGIIFQIVDDILDYSSQEETFGKEIGNDFFEGKITLPIILTYSKATKDEKEFLSKTFLENFDSNEQDKEKFLKTLNLIKKYDVLDDCKNLAFSYREKSISKLRVFDDSSYENELYRKCLITVLDYCIERIK